jgi:excinuclease ABC subunit A
MSAYARQYVEQLSRPDVDHVEGLPPSVAIEQRVTRGGWKSTVATVTEIHHFVRLLYARAGIQYCPDSGVPIVQQKVAQVVGRAEALVAAAPQRLLIPVIRDRKGFHTEIGQWALRQGCEWMRVDGAWIEAKKFRRLDRYNEHTIDVMLGRLQKKRMLSDSDRRLIEEVL